MTKLDDAFCAMLESQGHKVVDVTPWRPIATAPKDGRVIWIAHDDVGAFRMAWNPIATNEMFAPGQLGMWETIDTGMTWADYDDAGPDSWLPIEVGDW